jgi:hypothetical protein
MHKKNMVISNKITAIIIICAISAAVAVAGLFLMQKKFTRPVEKNLSEKVHVPITSQPVIDYNELGKDKELQILTKNRKTEYGIDKGVDIIVKSDESLKIGDSIVPMQEIIDKIRIKSGDVVEKDIEGLTRSDRISAFGIYVVKPEDNIWNIHFNFLKDYFDHKGIAISPLSDEPDRRGFSSGIGKILKFSEEIVNIYNIKERKIDVDLNLIYPLSKVVIYNMDRIFALLDRIDYKNVNRIQFDGETLWIHAEQ